MDLNSLAIVLQAALSPNPDERKAAEESLNQFQYTPQHLVRMLQIIVDGNCDMAVRQVASIHFKNFIAKNWSPHDPDEQSKILPSDKDLVRQNILVFIAQVPPLLRVQLGECLKTIIHADYPEQWASLLHWVKHNLQDQQVYGALFVLRLLSRKYEFKSDEERTPVYHIVEETFPHLLNIFNRLVQIANPSIEVADLIKLICKIFWSSIYLEIPKQLFDPNVFNTWMVLFLNILERPVPLEGEPADPELRKSWGWWKVKKWTVHILNRLYTRFGDLKLQNPENRAFAQMFQKNFAGKILECHLNLLNVIRVDGYLPDRVSNLILQYLSNSVSKSNMYNLLQPRLDILLFEIIFPLMCFNDNDQKLWDEDPHEYVRKGYDIIEDLYSPRTAAMDFVTELVRKRGKENLQKFILYIVEIFKRYDEAAVQYKPYRQKDGALLAIGVLCDKLKQTEPYKSELERMLVQHVFPEFSSPVGHLRAKAAWVAGQYAHINFSDTNNFRKALHSVVAGMRDQELPVRVDSVFALRSFVEACKDLGEIRPILPQLLDEFFKLMNEVENEDLVFTLETIVDKFGEEMAPYALGLCQNLAAAFWKCMNTTEADDEADDPGALAAVGCLRAISTILESVSRLPHLFVHIEPTLVPIMRRMLTTDGRVSIAAKGELHKEYFYIVFLRDQVVDEESLLQQAHINVLSSLKGSEDDAREALVYSYTKSFNAFAAKLSEDEANKLSGIDRVLSVFQNKYHKLHTTKSWDFIGLPQTAKRKLQMESNVIVGLFDTGITPQSESFKDDGLGPPPAKWKGSCRHYANFSGCNNKLIGAKYFKLDKNPDPEDILSPIDTNGHGTHTSSTLAGTLIPNANLFGLANGTARGAVPSARVAMYKVCWASYGCSDMDILAAFEAAIHDGVDVISISIGGASGTYLKDSIAVGSFHAMRHGIITVASAGNDGPMLGGVSNHAPWIFTVAASSIGRQFNSRVGLGNGQTVLGVGVNMFDPKQKLYPLATGADVAKNSKSKDSAGYCIEDSMDAKKVKGKLVHCKLSSWGIDSVVKGLGGIGTIIESERFLDAAQIFMAPSTMVNSTLGEIINHYISSTRSPSGVIYKSEEVKIPAPFIASFSSRGPSHGAKHLLKPDIAAPGVDILASYTPLKSLTGLKGDTQYSKFTLMSGTSMSCPHVGGVAAYVKSFHPKWSPSAIKSAIMTTATPMSSKVNQDAEFAYGAGQVNPRKAISPGLIYDMDDIAYIQFLCHEGYNGSSFAPLIGTKSINCSTLIPAHGEDAINYPTMQLRLIEGEPKIGVFRRTVRNVGPAQSTYNATIKAPKGVEITVEPTSLLFTRVSQERSFKVVVKVKAMSSAKILVSGSLIWRSPRHAVRSPIVVYNGQED